MLRACKKLVVFMLSLSMVFSLAACGSKEKAADTTATPTVGAADVAEATPTAVPERYEAFDFGGREIKVGLWWDYYYTSEHTKIEDDPALSNTETAQMKLDNVRRIEEKYNCKIKFVNLGWQGIINSINTTIAAGTPECDIYLTDLQFGIPAALNGLCQNVKDYAPANSSVFDDQLILKPLDGMGGTYFFQEQGLPQTGIFLGYNKTMIDDLGLEDPQELYKNGQWTWDKFAELAKAGTQDTNNDGTTDVYGYGGVFTDFSNGLIMNNGGSITNDGKGGLDSEPVKQAFEFINKIYNEDKSGRPWNETDWNDNLLAWSDGKVMFWTAQAWSLKMQADAAVAEGAEIPFEYHVVPYPKGPSGDGTPTSPFAGNWYMIPVGVQEPEKVFQIFEEFLDWFGTDTTYRDDPQWFESCFQSTEDVDIAYECGSNLKLDPWGCLAPYFDYGSTIFWPIVINKEKTVAQAVEAGKPVLQNALDYLYNK